MNTKAHRALRENFITEHYEKFVLFMAEDAGGRYVSQDLAAFIDTVARPTLEYGKRTDTVQIWLSLRGTFNRIYKQISVRKRTLLSAEQAEIAAAVFAVINSRSGVMAIYGIRTGKTYLFSMLDRYISSRPEKPTIEDFEQFIKTTTKTTEYAEQTKALHEKMLQKP